ncbi:MAG: 2,3-bisphosphoglycerate-independent phosphoglycerate mutase [Candidatus Woesearchaeota archaeon]
MSKNKVVLVIRDGYGRRDEREDNAVIVGDTPFTDYLMTEYPTCLLRTCGNDVGLPKGYMGGSEVGHLTIGAGRIVWESLELINRSISDGSFFNKKEFLDSISYAKQNDKAIHLMGLLQNKGVHSHQDHLFAMLKLCADKGIDKDKVIIHIFSDGRDSPAKSLKSYVDTLNSKIKDIGVGVIGSLIGRFYAMDRDTRWDRTKLAYDLLVKGTGNKFLDIYSAIDFAYDNNETDEFIKPKVIGNFSGIYVGDVVWFYNYRTDRVRQLCKALLDNNFNEFETENLSLKMVVLTNYYDNINADIVFKRDIPKNMLGEVISKSRLKQLRISETEKYPHVTFFFNGQRNDAFSDEERVLIPSPRDVKTYDEKPEMSIFEIKNRLLKEMDKDYDLIVVNYVNGDMVGHTGNMNAAVKAVEAVDIALKETVEVGLSKGYDFLIFADHGNCEEMSGEHQTSHTLNDVDCILVSNKKEFQKDKISLSYGGLRDISPTVLDILGLDKPSEMSGRSLIKKKL